MYQALNTDPANPMLTATAVRNGQMLGPGKYIAMMRLRIHERRYQHFAAIVPQAGDNDALRLAAPTAE